MIKFVRAGTREDGETLYRLERDDVVIRDGITLDEVVEAINRMEHIDCVTDQTPPEGS